MEVKFYHFNFEQKFKIDSFLNLISYFEIIFFGTIDYITPIIYRHLLAMYNLDICSFPTTIEV